MIICSLSGEATTSPVLSPRSGHIFDKRLLETYIETHGKDPINNQVLTIEDLIPVNQMDASVIPVPNNLTSIPNLLSQFQKEWDALAIELFTLRKSLKEAREELSIALYHQDAAVRVAAKAVQERDEAKKALEEMAISLSKGDFNGVDKGEPGADYVEDEEMGVNVELKVDEKIAKDIQQSQLQLFNLHKSNKKKASFNSDTEISLEVNEDIDLQAALKDITGFKTALITNTAVDPQNANRLLISFDNNHALIYDLENHSLVDTLKPKKKKSLVSVNWLQEEAVSPLLGFEDGTIYVEEELLVSGGPKKKLVALLTHPSLNLFIILHENNFQIYYNRELVATCNTEYNIISADLHGDGVLLAIGSDDGVVHIYDISQNSEVSKFNEQTGKSCVSSTLKFAPNGYWLIAQFDSHLQVFDLRKMISVFEIDYEGKLISIDFSSQLIYLATTSETQIQLSYLRYFKKLKTFKLISDHCTIEEVSKLKKTHTQIVSSFENSQNGELVLVHNSNHLKTVSIANI